MLESPEGLESCCCLVPPELDPVGLGGAWESVSNGSASDLEMVREPLSEGVD